MKMTKEVSIKKTVWWCGCEIGVNEPTYYFHSEVHWERGLFHRKYDEESQTKYVCKENNVYRIEKYKLIEL